jgi:hypothetical protein
VVATLAGDYGDVDRKIAGVPTERADVHMLAAPVGSRLGRSGTGVGYTARVPPWDSHADRSLAIRAEGYRRTPEVGKDRTDAAVLGTGEMNSDLKPDSGSGREAGNGEPSLVTEMELIRAGDRRCGGCERTAVRSDRNQGKHGCQTTPRCYSTPPVPIHGRTVSGCAPPTPELASSVARVRTAAVARRTRVPLTTEGSSATKAVARG